MASTDDYAALITSEHRGMPRFEAAIRTLTQGFADAAAVARDMLAKHDLDIAAGDQLDTLGLWVGVTRRVPVPLTGYYFTWADTVATGWSSGQWKGPFDPGSGIVLLGDSDFRLLIRAKIAANMWDGTNEELDQILSILFNPTNVWHYDIQNMQLRITYKQAQLSAVQKALLTGDVLAIKPAGVKIVYVAV